jgi:hypothetical protein
MKSLLLTLFIVLGVQLLAGCGQMEKKQANRVLYAVQLTCEYRQNPLGIETQHPRLGWKLALNDTIRHNVRQTAYRILAASERAKLDNDEGDLWDSGKIPSGRQMLVKYEGKKSGNARRVYWKVRVWDEQERASAWSETAFWETGLLTKKGWDDSRWIAYEKLDKTKQIVPGIPHTKEKGLPRDVIPQFRKEFKIDKNIKSATLFISGLGQYEAYMNGAKIGSDFLDPAWTNYRKTCFYNAFDVTRYLRKGANVLGVILGNGMFFIPQERYTKFVIAYGYPQMRAKLILTYMDGSREAIGTNRSFKTAPSPIVFSSIYGGEDYNATLELQGWKKAGFDDSSWKNSVDVDGPGGELKAQSAPPLKVMDTFMPIQISTPQKNIWVYDMRQNASAIPKITVKGSRGDEVTIIPGELLDKNGLVTQSATGSPYQLKYRLKGNGIEEWQPRFTYYGYRYLQVENAIPAGRKNPGNLPVIINLQSLHTRNSAERTGRFSCSNELFNRIYHLIDWGMRSNMASVLTDCPHREKLGWLEQAHLMAASIRYNYNVPNLLSKIVDDMREAQTKEGLIPDIAPEYPVFSRGFRDSPEWGSAFVILPWYIYQWYGDMQPLQKNYEAMKRYAAYLQSKSEGNIVSHGLGDWYDIGPKKPGPAQLTPKALTATAIYYYDVTILQKTAALLGNKEDEEKFSQLAEQIKIAFNKKFFHPENSQYAGGSQTANAMAVYMGLVKNENRQAVIDNLVKGIEKNGYKLTAGDIGYRYVLRVLEDAGRPDIIFAMNNRSDVPGYGYQLIHGATALTESWQAYRNVSNNHMMLGHLMEWFYSGLAGIQVDLSQPVKERIIIKPQITGDITWVKAGFNMPLGKIESNWRRQGNLLFMDVVIPPNTQALIYIPSDNKNRITESGKSISLANGILNIDYENNSAVLRVGSGHYHFQSILVK